MARFTDDEEAKYAEGRLPYHVYISKSWPYSETATGTDSLAGRATRFAYEVFDSHEESIFESENGIAVTLRETPTRQQVKAVFFEDDREIPRVILQRFGPEGNPYVEHMSLVGPEVTALREFLDAIRALDLPDDDALRFSSEVLTEIMQHADVRQLLYSDNRDLIVELIEQDVDARDIVAVAHRRRVVEEFGPLPSLWSR